MPHPPSRYADPDAPPLVGWFVVATECLGSVALVVVVGFLLHVFLGG